MNCKSLLRRCPLFYGFAQKIYYKTREIAERRFVGTRLQKTIWKTQHIFRGKRFVEEYWKSVDHPHRQYLLGKMKRYEPFESIAEIGCNVGANLYLLSKQYPGAKLYGVDVNKKAIEVGMEKVGALGSDNISMSVGSADDLSMFEDKSIDLVFTDAVIMYVAPDMIDTVFGEIFRIARKAVFFNEWHYWNDGEKVGEHPYEKLEGRNYYHYGHWIYDYRLLAAKHAKLDNVKVSKIPKEIWRDAGWEKWGSVIEVGGLTI